MEYQNNSIITNHIEMENLLLPIRSHQMRSLATHDIQGNLMI